MDRNLLSPMDTIVFIGVLLISAAIGVFFAVKDTKRQTTENYYYGGRNLSPIPVAASLAVSYISAIAVIAVPSEVYLYGSIFAWDILGQFIANMIAVVLFIPFFHRIKLKTVYEYLELRFNSALRRIASFLVWVNLFLYLGIVTYLPALALSAVTPVSLHVAIALTSLVCTFYTTIGGIKAVVWTDVLQTCVMLAGMLGLFVCSVMEVGKLGDVMKAAERGERINFMKFDPDPRIRSTFWTVGIGRMLDCLFMVGCDQVYIQRYLSCESVKTARIALLLAFIPQSALILTTIGNGLAMYAVFEDCDPMTNGDIEKIDQSIPYLAAKVFSNAPGMLGLFVSAAYCGTLSSVSSGINAMSGLVLHDFILVWKKNLSQNLKMVISVSLSIMFGILVMVLAYLVSFSGTHAFQICISITACITGPMVGIFIMGMIVPWINSKGALCGFICGWVAVGWIAISAMFSTGLYSPENNGGKLPLSTRGCTLPNTNTTWMPEINETSTQSIMDVGIQEGPGLARSLYSISPFLYGIVGFIVCIVVGNTVSLVTGCNKDSQMDGKLLITANYSLKRGTRASEEKIER